MARVPCPSWSRTLDFPRGLIEYAGWPRWTMLDFSSRLHPDEPARLHRSAWLDAEIVRGGPSGTPSLAQARENDRLMGAH